MSVEHPLVAVGDVDVELDPLLPRQECVRSRRVRSLSPFRFPLDVAGHELVKPQKGPRVELDDHVVEERLKNDVPLHRRDFAVVRHARSHAVGSRRQLDADTLVGPVFAAIVLGRRTLELKIRLEVHTLATVVGVVEPAVACGPVADSVELEALVRRPPLRVPLVSH